MQELPAMAGIELANWNWKVVHQFVLERFGIVLSRSGCLNYLHRLGFAFKRPKKRLLKADGAKREAFVAEYAALTEEARRSGAKIFFADEAHFRADAELRGKWVLKGKPALVDSTSPRYGEKASYYSAVCLETGEVEWMELEGNSNSGTSAAFLSQLRQGRAGPLRVIWDNAPALGARRCGSTCGRRVCWTGEPAGVQPGADEMAGNLCLGSREAVQERVGKFLAGLKPERRGETALPDSPAIKGRITPERHPAGITTPGKCASHLGFGLVLQDVSSIWSVFGRKSLRGRQGHKAVSRGQVSIKRCSRFFLANSRCNIRDCFTKSCSWAIDSQGLLLWIKRAT